MNSARVLFTAALVLLFTAQTAEAQMFGQLGQARTGAQRSQDRQLAQIPRCDRPLGTLSIVDGDPLTYSAMDLQPPQALLRLVVQRSGCFTLVDRGSNTLEAVERERRLADSGALQRGSNLGAGQMRAADFILLAEIASENDNASGMGARGNVKNEERGGGLGRGLLGAASAVANPLSGLGNVRASGGVDSRTAEANTVLSIVNVRTTETVAVSQGYAAKRDINWSLSGAADFGGFVGGGYENTEIGRIVAQSFINAYANIVKDLENMDTSVPIAEQAPMTEDVSRTVAQPSAPSQLAAAQPISIAMRVIQSTTLREGPGGPVLRVMRGGQTVFPTGETRGEWVEIIDESEEIGWIQRDRLMADN